MTETPTTPKMLTDTKKVVNAIPFFANLAALNAVTLVSNPISSYYKIVGIEAHFRDDTANLVRIGVYSANNRNVSGNLPPPDNSVTSALSPTPFLIGEGEIISLKCEYEPAPNYQYIKVYFSNGNNYAITAFCVVTIEAIIKVPAPINLSSAEFLNETGKINIELQAKGKAITDLVADTYAGTPQWFTPPIASVVESKSKFQEKMQLTGSELEFVDNFVKPEMTDQQKAEAYKAWFRKLQLFQAEQQMALASEDLINSILPNGTNIYSTSVGYYNSTFPTTAFAGKMNDMVYNAAWGKSLLRLANEKFLPEIPDVSELINEVVKEVIPLSEFKNLMAKSGYSPSYSQNIWDAHFIQPSFGDVQRAIWKGGIKKDDVVKYLKLVDLDPRFNESVWFPLLQNHPNISDAVNMLVKEVIPQSQFDELLLTNGFSKYWGQRFWDAHFQPAQFQDFLTAMRRKKTVSIPVAGSSPVSHTFGVNVGDDIEKIRKLSELADYDPRYWDFFETRMFNDPSYRMIQWGYEGNAITEEEVPDLVHRLGLNPKDELWYGKFITGFQERPWITKYLTALAGAYTENVISADELKKRVTAIPRNEAVANWIIKISDVRKEISTAKPADENEKLISLGELKQMRFKGIISEDEFTGELLNRGYTQLDVAKLNVLINIQLEELTQGGAKVGLTIAELFDAFKYGQVDENEVRTDLMLKGMTLQDANVLIATKKLKWGTEK